MHIFSAILPGLFSVCFFLTGGWLISGIEALPEARSPQDQNFDHYLSILKKVDECEPADQTAYSPENTFFYFLKPSKEEEYLLVETYIGCGFTGSCGSRCLLIRNQSKVVWEACGFIDELAPYCEAGQITFILLNRGYQTGQLVSYVSGIGENWETTPYSRDGIPLEILEKLDLRDCTAEDFFFDCYSVSDLEIDSFPIDAEGRKGYLVTGPRYIFDNYKSDWGETFWFFPEDETDKITLGFDFQEMEDVHPNPVGADGRFSVTLYPADAPAANTAPVKMYWNPAKKEWDH